MFRFFIDCYDRGEKMQRLHFKISVFFSFNFTFDVFFLSPTATPQRDLTMTSWLVATCLESVAKFLASESNVSAIFVEITKKTIVKNVFRACSVKTSRVLGLNLFSEY